MTGSRASSGTRAGRGHSVFPEGDDIATGLSARSSAGIAGDPLARRSAFVWPSTFHDGADGRPLYPASVAPLPAPSGAATGPSGARDRAGSASVANETVGPTAPEPAAVLLALLILLMMGLPWLAVLGRFGRDRRTRAPREEGVEPSKPALPGDRQSSRPGRGHRDRSRTRPSPPEFPIFLVPRDRRGSGGD